MVKELSWKQKKSRARHQLFWYLKSICLKRFLENAIRHNAVTMLEYDLLDNAVKNIELIQKHYISNSRNLGLNAKRRCEHYGCNHVAEYKAYTGYEYIYLCKNHIHNEQQGYFNIKLIDPTK